MRRYTPLLVFTAATALVVACSVAPEEKETTASVREAIVNGTNDTTHGAVVGVDLMINATSGNQCSGTIVRVSGTTGTVMTAAHCFQNAPTTVKILTGSNIATPQATFTATSWALYPTTSGALYDAHHDLALIQFSGASASTPVIPLAQPAAYGKFAVSAPFVLVGYGHTSGSPTAPNNTVRKKLDVTLSRFNGSWVDTTSPSGTSCYGDSGGALLDVSTGTTRLAGAIQGGGSACTPGEVNGSVGFYAPEIAAWLRSQGFDMPDAPQPNGVACTNDADCASGACLRLSGPGGTLINACGAPAGNGARCQRATQCASLFCRQGACSGCTVSTECGAALVCSGGKCMTPGPDAGATDGGAGDAGATDGGAGDAGADDAGTVDQDSGGAVDDAAVVGDAAATSTSDDAGTPPPANGASTSGSETPSTPSPPGTAPPAADSAAPTQDGCAASPRTPSSGAWSALLIAGALLIARRRSCQACRAIIDAAQLVRGRVAPGRCLPGAPMDPDVQVWKPFFALTRTRRRVGMLAKSSSSITRSGRRTSRLSTLPSG